MTIRSNPPGAFVYVDNYPIGTTPVSTNFTHYGTRSIRLVKDGFETQTAEERVAAPWYEVPPLDFISENLVLGEIRDHRTFDYQMHPQMVVPTNLLLDRAEDLRSRAGTTGMFRSSSFESGRDLTPVPINSGPSPSLAPPRGFQPELRSPSVLPPSGPVIPPVRPGGEDPRFHTLPPGGQHLR